MAGHLTPIFMPNDLGRDIAVDIGPDGQNASPVRDDDAWLAVPVGESVLFVLGGSPEGKRVAAEPDRPTVESGRVRSSVYLSSLPKETRDLVYRKLREALAKPKKVLYSPSAPR